MSGRRKNQRANASAPKPQPTPSATSSAPPAVIDPADQLKIQGNKFLEEHQYAKALAAYSEAIELKPTAIYYGNRSKVYLELERYADALLDANKALELDATYTKAYHRRGCAFIALNKFERALTDFRKVVAIAPSDVESRLRLDSCEKAVRAQQEYLASKAKEPKASDVIDISQIKVDKAYHGPRLPADGSITREFIIEMVVFLKEQQRLHHKFVYQILVAAKDIISREPTVLDLSVEKKLTVCGDTHGQFYDVLNIFALNGFPSEENPYLFNGDFVDRGAFGLEIMLVFLAFKVWNPKSIYLLRGNHESQQINMVYGFFGEISTKYKGPIGKMMFELFQELFNWLPLAATIDKKTLVLHGGLFSDDHVKLQDLKAIFRNRDIPEEGLMQELLWSDPQPLPGRMPSRRGVGSNFGPDVTQRFLEMNGLDLIIRSHEMKMDGYEVTHDGMLVTLFSCPNYCDMCGNLGAYAVFDGPGSKPRFEQFKAVPHPTVKENYMGWSI